MNDPPDVVVVILDEFASLDSSPLKEIDTERLLSLREDGYELVSSIWSPYTVSAAAVPAILDGAYPVGSGATMAEGTVRELGAVSRGNNRLVRSLQDRDYTFTLVESGLWMSSCGPRVDVRVVAQPIDEMMGRLLERSAFRWWYGRLWGDSFTASGLWLREETHRTVLEAAGNGAPDLIISHIMLPHVPYLLDSTCQRHGQDQDQYLTRESRLEAYRRQAGCVVGWLRRLIRDLEGEPGPPPAVVVVGDHGTNLADQLASHWPSGRRMR